MYACSLIATPYFILNIDTYTASIQTQLLTCSYCRFQDDGGEQDEKPVQIKQTTCDEQAEARMQPTAESMGN